MSLSKFLESELNGLKSIQVPENLIGLPTHEAIKKQLLSNKYRKYSATPEFISKIENAIQYNLDRNKPIELTLPHGSYKLWRLKSAPEADWAELFAHIYYTQWLKPICDIYKPGVVLDCYLDDIMLERLNDIPQQDIAKYQQSYHDVLNLLDTYRPKNFESKITTVSSLFSTKTDLFTAVEKKLSVTIPSELTEKRLKSIYLNLPEEKHDNVTVAKISHLEDAYQSVKSDIGYRDNRPDNIPIWFEKHPSRLAVGSTKNSIMKFWIATGVLIKNNETYTSTILSESQLKKYKTTKHPINLHGLNGKNFQTITTVELKTI